MNSGKKAINGAKEGEEAMFNLENIWDTVITVLLAVAGGLARLLNGKDRKRLKWSNVLSELFVAGFAGIMALMLARASGLTGDWVGLLCGIAGWTSPKILYTLTKTTEKIFGFEENSLKKD